MKKRIVAIAIIAPIIAVLVLMLCLENVEFNKQKPHDYSGQEIDLSNEYVITQYSDASGVQACIYTIENKDYFLIIDGGWAENEGALREIIAAHGNQVDAWIISHPHRDHAGAFNAIFADPQGITISAIYDNGFDYDFIESVGEPYDDITVMETYYALTKDESRVIHLKRGDIIEVCGLTLEILNAFDQAVLDHVGDQKDYQNNASLLFRISAEEQSMLFCSDIKYDMNEYLLENYGHSISCDYVQTGHHGNWSFSDEFYEKTGASVFFIDAPESITEVPDFPASKLKDDLIAKGKIVLDFGTAPNAVALK